MTYQDPIYIGPEEVIYAKRAYSFETYTAKMDWQCYKNRGIKYDFPFINILKVPREVLITESEARDFQHWPRELANVNE